MSGGLPIVAWRAARAVGLVLPELAGKLDGTAMRVPTPNVSAVDLTFQASRDVTVEEINAAARAAADGPMKRVLAYDPEQKVSIDFNHTEESCIFAPDQTIEDALRPHWEAAENPDSPQAAALQGPPVDNLFFVAFGRSAFMGARSADPARVRELIPVIQRCGRH